MKQNLEIDKKNITVIPPNDKLYTYDDLLTANSLGFKAGKAWEYEEELNKIPFLSDIFLTPPQNTTSEPQG